MTRTVHLLQASVLAAWCVVGVAALDATPASAATKGFYIHNFTGTTVKLSQVATFGRAPVFAEPASSPVTPLKGDLLTPGEVMHVELNDQFSNTSANLYRREAVLSFAAFPTPRAGQPTPAFQVSLVTGERFGPANQVQMRCVFDAAANQCPVNGTTAELLDPPGTHIKIPATDASAQAAVLTDVCTKANEETGGTCKFDPTKRGEPTTHAAEPVSDPVINCSHKEIEVKEAAEHKVGTTNSVEIGNEFEVEVGFAENHVKSSVHFTYGHEWIDEHKFSKEIPVPIEPQHKGWVDHGAPVIRFTGDFTLTVGNTTFTLTGVYFDHPDTGRTGTFFAQEDKATAAELKSCKGSTDHVRLPKSDLTVTRRGTAGSELLSGGSESDVFRALGGNDVVGGGNGADRLVGGPGNDLLVGGAGHDVLDGGPGADMIIDTAGPTRVQTASKTGHGWDYVYVRDGRANDRVVCGSRHTHVVADKGDRVRGHCGEVIRRGPVRRPRLPFGLSSP